MKIILLSEQKQEELSWRLLDKYTRREYGTLEIAEFRPSDLKELELNSIKTIDTKQPLKPSRFYYKVTLKDSRKPLFFADQELFKKWLDANNLFLEPR